MEKQNNFSGTDLGEFVKLPEVNTVVTVEIPNETFIWLGAVLLVNVILFLVGFYWIVSNKES